MAASAAAGKRLRSDAERNREAILGAAAAAYADQGCETSLEVVARLAGVGVGTVYRRFPTKTALIEALLEGAMRKYAEQTERAAALAETEPWEAFREHVTALVTMQAADRAFSEVITEPSAVSPGFQEVHRQALRASLALTAKAARAGVVRPDFEHRDLLLLTHAVHGVVTAGGPEVMGRSLRLAELFLDACSTRRRAR